MKRGECRIRWPNRRRPSLELYFAHFDEAGATTCARHATDLTSATVPRDTFGWVRGAVDETLDNLAINDPVSAESFPAHFAYWNRSSLVGHPQGQPQLVSNRPNVFCGASAAWRPSCFLLHEAGHANSA